VRYCEACRAAFQALRTCPKDKIATRADLEDPLVGYVLGDRYRVLERIASGGMGQVYRAAHTRIASLFAVKVLYGDLAYDEQMRVRFAREAEAAACLQSRHIVRVVDFSESSEGLLYLAMEHLEGQTLSQVIADKPLAPNRAVSIATQIARGLAHAHERGIVHRDLKPGNVMLIREDDEPDVVRLLDFGIARLGDGGGLTVAGALMGTPEYMSPEQYRGEGVDARSDLYALGIMLFEMVTGSLPFASDSLVEFAKLHAYAAPPSIAERGGARDIAPELEAVIRRLLAKRQEDRFASAREVIEALRHLPAPPPRSSASPPSVAALSALSEPICGQANAEKIHEAIQVGAPTYNAGDHAACAAIYRKTCQALLAGALREDTKSATAARLQVGVRRADNAGDATRAAWELRYAFDDVLLVVRPAIGSEIAMELAAAEAIAAPRLAVGEVALVNEFYLAFASRVAAVLRDQNLASTVGQRLEAAVARAREPNAGGQGALTHVAPLLEELRQKVRLTSPRVTTGKPLRLACPLAASFAERITQAITLGAPAYNRGDHEACYAGYRAAAEEIVGAAAAHEGCASLADLLAAALEKAAPLGSTQGAWTLRHAFDTILEEAAATA
jgi:eukaryotic-like serine/threonine-protein kinase